MIVNPGIRRSSYKRAGIPLANRVAHFHAGVGVTSAGGFASAWADQSGNGRSLLQASGANQPAYNTSGLPYLEFNGTSHFMKCSAFTLSQPTTVYLVAKQVTWTVSDYLFDGNADNSGAVITRTLTPKINAYAGSFITDNADMTVGAFKVVCAQFNGASSLLQVNANAATTGNVGAANMGGFTLGSAGVTLSPANIQVYEVLIYNVAHAAATRSNITAALMAKWGIT